MKEGHDALSGHLANLLTVLGVAEAGSMTGASRRRHKATSAISRSVAELEHAIGAPLFERVARGVRATEHGDVVLTRARRAGKEIDRAVDLVLRWAGRAQQPSQNVVRSVLASDRKLRLIIDIAETRSISAAAQRARISQAGASMALSRIEAALGISLFSRNADGLAPGEQTMRLVESARLVMAELRHLQADIVSVTGRVGGLIIVGTTHLGRTYSLPTAIASTIAAHPDIRVRSVEGSYQQLVGLLRAGEIDMLFGALRPEDLGSGLLGEPLFTDRMSVLAGASHPLARQQSLQLNDLIGQKWILPRLAFGQDRVEACFRRSRLPLPRASVETGDLATLRQLLEIGTMIAIASPRQMAFELDYGLLRELPVTLAGTEIDIGLVWRENALLPKAGTALIREVHRLAALG